MVTYAKPSCNTWCFTAGRLSKVAMSDIIFVEMYRFHLSMQHRYQSTHILKNRNILDTILRQITINQCKMSNEGI